MSARRLVSLGFILLSLTGMAQAEIVASTLVRLGGGVQANSVVVMGNGYLVAASTGIIRVDAVSLQARLLCPETGATRLWPRGDGSGVDFRTRRGDLGACQFETPESVAPYPGRGAGRPGARVQRGGHTAWIFGEELWVKLEGDTARALPTVKAPTALTMSRGGELLAVADAEGTLWLLELPSTRLSGRLRTELGRITGLDYDLMRRRVVAVSDRGQLQAFTLHPTAPAAPAPTQSKPGASGPSAALQTGQTGAAVALR